MMKNRRTSGFTLAELLIVVAIIMILMGVSFVAVQNHQRSMTRLEFDTIAREIFFAAQNHLTEAESQGYLQNVKLGDEGTLAEDTEKEVYYILNGSEYKEVLDLILPPYALDETIRSGNFIIRYQPSSATVLDVFYSLDGRSSFLTIAGTTLGEDGYTYVDLMSGCRGDDKRSARQGFGSKRAVIGWYGGEKAADIGARLRAPSFEIINEERLHVELTDYPDNSRVDHMIKLIVIGKTSKAEVYFPLNKGTTENSHMVTSGEAGSGKYTVILDDITESNKHFAQIKPDKGEFIPGEDLIVKAVAYSSNELANVAMSAEKTTNSLFADPDVTSDAVVRGSRIGDGTSGTAGIAYFRHLENLDSHVSNLGKNSNASAYITISNAAQLNDLDWEKAGLATITSLSTTIATGKYYPVTPSHYDANVENLHENTPLKYNGQYNSVKNVAVSHDGDSGLFGELVSNSSNSEVKDLKLIDFDIISSNGNAGALVGTVKGSTITNVLAINEKKTDAVVTIKANGDAGGLIGNADTCTVSKSAAALVVEGSNNAGGLIGTISSGTVSGCYSGGHTYSGVPDGGQHKYDDPHANVYPVRYYDASNNAMYNVTSTVDSAGGLIGDAGSTTITNSYSTCSVKGTTAGGFIGTGSGSITNCYCTGLVIEPTNTEQNRGAFAGVYTATATDCYYFEIINEYRNKDDDGNETSGYYYLRPIGNLSREETIGITAFDESASSYNAFTGSPSSWQKAYPYDAGGTDGYGLKIFYKVNGESRYNLKTVAQLDPSGDYTGFVKDHYGDWPAPEEFIFN